MENMFALDLFAIPLGSLQPSPYHQTRY